MVGIRSSLKSALLLLLLVAAGLSALAANQDDLDAKIRGLRGKTDFNSKTQLAILFLEKYHHSKEETDWLATMELALQCRKQSPHSALPQLIMARAFLAKGKKRLALERALWAHHYEPKNALVQKQLKEFGLTDKQAAFMFGCPNYDALCPALKEERSFFEDAILLGQRYTQEVTAFGIIAIITMVMVGIVILYLIWTCIRLFFKITWKLFKLVFGIGRKPQAAAG